MSLIKQLKRWGSTFMVALVAFSMMALFAPSARAEDPTPSPTAPATTDDTSAPKVKESPAPVAEETPTPTPSKSEAPKVKESPAPVVVETPTPTPTPSKTSAFDPRIEKVRWLVPESVGNPKGKSINASFFPQPRLMGALQCGRWSQDDTYGINSKADDDVFKSLGNTLEWLNGKPEDNKIYKSHTFTYGGDCPPTFKLAQAEIVPIPATCEAAGSAEWTTLVNASGSELNQTPGTHSGVATADEGAKFSDDTTTKSVDYAIQDKLPPQSTDENAPCYVPPTKPAGESSFSYTCNALTVNAPTGVKPEGAEYVNKLDGTPVGVGEYPITAGDYTLTLEVNGVQVDSDTFMVEACPPKTLVDLGFNTKCKVLKVHNPDTNPAITLGYGDFDSQDADGWIDIQPGATATIKTDRKVLDIMAYVVDGDYNSLMYENVPISQKCGSTGGNTPTEDNGDQPLVPTVVPAVMPAQPTNGWPAAISFGILALVAAGAGVRRLRRQ